MNSGFVTKKREEELWETQRIITQLKVTFIDYGSDENFIEINNSVEEVANVREAQRFDAKIHRY